MFEGPETDEIYQVYSFDEDVESQGVVRNRNGTGVGGLTAAGGIGGIGGIGGMGGMHDADMDVDMDQDEFEIEAGLSGDDESARPASRVLDGARQRAGDGDGSNGGGSLSGKSRVNGHSLHHGKQSAAVQEVIVVDDDD